MRQASKRIPKSAEKTVRDIRRATRRHHSAEEKIPHRAGRPAWRGQQRRPLTLPHYMAQDAMAVFAHGRARRLHHDAFGKEDRLVGQNERALSLPESHTRRISAPSRNSWQGDAILPLCEPGDRAMWIVMYVAMIASLSAMGMLPVAELPHDDA